MVPSLGAFVGATVGLPLQSTATTGVAVGGRCAPYGHSPRRWGRARRHGGAAAPGSPPSSVPPPPRAVHILSPSDVADALPPSTDFVDDGSTVWWDASVGLTGAVVRHFPENETGEPDGPPSWLMWYSAVPGGGDSDDGGAEGGGPRRGGAIGVATSADGLRWTRHRGGLAGGAVFTPNTDEWWAFDTVAVDVADVVVGTSPVVRAEGGIFFLYYTGTCGEVDAAGVVGGRTRLGVALSKDGWVWSRVEGAHHSGALFDTGGGENPGWDAGGIGAPSTLRLRDGSVLMYYTGRPAPVGGVATDCGGDDDGGGGEAGRPAAAAAPPAPPRHWARHLPRRADVRQPTATHYLFHEVPAADGRVAIGVATSCDGGLTWSRVGPGGGAAAAAEAAVEAAAAAAAAAATAAAGTAMTPTAEAGVARDSAAPVPPPIFTAPSLDDDAAAWDAGGVGRPCAVVTPDGGLRLYYRGVIAGAPWAAGGELGVAFAPADDWTALTRERPAGEGHRGREGGGRSALLSLRDGGG
ncbi:hypothetical protein MMPV_001770 [Pyropia vietnamensis]